MSCAGHYTCKFQKNKALHCQLGFNHIHETSALIWFSRFKEVNVSRVAVFNLRCEQGDVIWKELSRMWCTDLRLLYMFDIPDWCTGTTAWTRSCIHFSHTNTGSPHRSVPSATSSSEGVFKRKKVYWCVMFSVNTSVYPCLFPGGLRPVTGLLRVTRVSSATSASECCTITLKATSWENSWPILMWTRVHLTN